MNYLKLPKIESSYKLNEQYVSFLRNICSYD